MSLPVVDQEGQDYLAALQQKAEKTLATKYMSEVVKMNLKDLETKPVGHFTDQQMTRHRRAVDLASKFSDIRDDPVWVNYLQSDVGMWLEFERWGLYRDSVGADLHFSEYKEVLVPKRSRGMKCLLVLVLLLLLVMICFVIFEGLLELWIRYYPGHTHCSRSITGRLLCFDLAVPGEAGLAHYSAWF